MPGNRLDFLTHRSAVGAPSVAVAIREVDAFFLQAPEVRHSLGKKVASTFHEYDDDIGSRRVQQ